MAKQASKSKQAEESKEDKGAEDKGADVTSAPVLPFRVMTQFLQDFSFENPGALLVQSGSVKSRPHYNANWHITNSPLETKESDESKAGKANLYQAEVRFTLSAHYDGEEDKKIPCFMLELAFVAIVEIAFNITDKKIHEQILRIEIPRLLYPYLRYEVDKVLQTGGYPPMHIPPLNFVAAYEQFMQQGSAKKSS